MSSETDANPRQVTGTQNGTVDTGAGNGSGNGHGTLSAPAPERPAQQQTAGPAAPPEQTPPPPQESGWMVPLLVLIVGMFMSVLDTSIVNVAIPRMQTALSASVDDIEWVVTAYTLMLGVVVPLSGWLGLRIGLTRLYVICLGAFSVGSALCGLAWSLESEIAFRIIQAIPGGILPVATLTLLYQIVPPQKLGSAMGIYGLGVVVAPAIGPTLGGYLVEYVSWRVIFLINVPVGILGIILALIVFPQIKPTTWPKLDIWGFVTIAYALFALLLAFSEGEDWGWTGYRVLGLFVSAGLSLMLFLIIENEVDNPLINLQIFRSFAFTVSLVLLVIAMTALFSALYFLPQFLQIVQGLPELQSGLVLLPGALVMTVMMPIAGRLYDMIGPRYPVMIGLAIIAYGSYLMAGITVNTPRVDIEEWLAIRNLGVGLAMMPVITAGVASLPRALTAAGSSVNNVMQRVAASVAIAVFGSLNTVKAAQLLDDRGGLAGAGTYAGGQIAGPEGIPVTNPDQMLGTYQSLQNAITTQTYANGFYVVAILAAVGAVLGVFMRSGKQGGGGHGPVEV